MKESKNKGASRIDYKHTHGWFVRIYRYPNLTFSKMFSDGVYGGWEQALVMAETFRDVAETILPNTSAYRYLSATKPDVKNSTGILGVSETYSRNRNGSISPHFCVSWYDEIGKQHNKSFAILKHGREKALQMAIEFRRQNEAERIERQQIDIIELDKAVEITRGKWNELIASYDFSIPEEVFEGDDLYEGTVHRIIVNAYERNPEARLKCISHYGSKCFVCGFDFEKVYGEVGQGIIHVHHLTPLSSIGEEYQVDPIKDMRPICPNCHVIIHKKQPPYSIEKAKEFFNQQGVKSVS